MAGAAAGNAPDAAELCAPSRVVDTLNGSEVAGVLRGKSVRYWNK